MVKIENLKLKGIGGIEDLELRFKDGLNLICGPNGVGKTTILDSIAYFFTNQPQDSPLRRNVNFKHGRGSGKFNVDGKSVIEAYYKSNYRFDDRNIEKNDNFIFQNPEISKNVIVFKSHRNIDYKLLESISKDPQRTELELSREMNFGTSSNDLKNWFINRFMWSSHKNAISKEYRQNLEKAKECFNLLDENVRFSTVQGDTFDILVDTPSGQIYFEYLSSGYKSSLYILLGLIKEIEYRFKSPQIEVEDFDGIVLIDEIDLHLHPQWQVILINSIKRIIPKAQIIATTHSPTMIQIAEPKEMIPLGFDKDKKVILREIPSSEYGFQGWTIEEILTDVMGLKEVRSEKYLSMIGDFDEALDNEDVEKAKELYKILKKMIHPENHLLKLLKLQMATLGGDDEE